MPRKNRTAETARVSYSKAQKAAARAAGVPLFTVDVDSTHLPGTRAGAKTHRLTFQGSLTEQQHVVYAAILLSLGIEQPYIDEVLRG